MKKITLLFVVLCMAYVASGQSDITIVAKYREAYKRVQAELDSMNKSAEELQSRNAEKQELLKQNESNFEKLLAVYQNPITEWRSDSHTLSVTKENFESLKEMFLDNPEMTRKIDNPEMTREIKDAISRIDKAICLDKAQRLLQERYDENSVKSSALKVEDLVFDKREDKKLKAMVLNDLNKYGEIRELLRDYLRELSDRAVKNDLNNKFVLKGLQQDGLRYVYVFLEECKGEYNVENFIQEYPYLYGVMMEFVGKLMSDNQEGTKDDYRRIIDKL